MIDSWISFYQKQFSNLDKKARTNLYIANKPECTGVLTKTQSETLKRDINIANLKIRKCKRLSNMAWTILFLKTSCDIENNFPHTHYDTIFLYTPHYFNMKPIERVILLIHEKLHVYQRMYPIPYHNILLHHYNLRVDSFVHKHPDFERVRKNPDTNMLIYKDSDNSYSLPLYENKDASRLSDVTNKKYNTDNSRITKYSNIGNGHEHPNEAIAYFISESLVRNKHIMSSITQWL